MGTMHHGILRRGMEEAAVVAHHFWNEPGGAELVMASAAQALEELGVRTSILSPTDVDLEKYREFFGLSLSGVRVIGPRLKMKRFALYSRLLLLPMLSRYSGKGEMILIDSPFYRKNGSPIAEYIHFPIELYFKNASDASAMEGADPYIAEKYGRFPWNIYLKSFLMAASKLSRKNPFESASLVLVNSAWTGNIVRDLYGERPEVLNPPLPPSVEAEASSPLEPFEERENIAVMLGRFSEEKRYHWVIEKVFPRILKEIEDARLYIIGSSSTPHSKGYLSSLLRLAEKSSMKASFYPECSGEVCFLPNAPSSLKSSVFGKAKVFLHATINEHWGIAVSEAMARGLPVVVHRSGGAWSDLAENGKRGIGYEDEEEAAEAIAELMSRGDLWKKYSQLSLERAKELRYEKFKERLGSLIRKL